MPRKLALFVPAIALLLVAAGVERDHAGARERMVATPRTPCDRCRRARRHRRHRPVRSRCHAGGAVARTRPHGGPGRSLREQAAADRLRADDSTLCRRAHDRSGGPGQERRRPRDRDHRLSSSRALTARRPRLLHRDRRAVGQGRGRAIGRTALRQRARARRRLFRLARAWTRRHRRDGGCESYPAAAGQAAQARRPDGHPGRAGLHDPEPEVLVERTRRSACIPASCCLSASCP